MLRHDIIDIPEITISAIVVFMCVLIFYYFNNEADLEDSCHIVMNFYKDPDYDDFVYILNHRKQLPANVDYWLYGVSESQPHFIKFAEVTRGVILTREIRRRIERTIDRCRYKPTAKMLDDIWAIYFGSGDPKYSKIIADVALGRTNASPIVRESASWSYNSIMGHYP